MFNYLDVTLKEKFWPYCTCSKTLLYFTFERILVLNWGENKNNHNLTFYAEVTKWTVMPSNLGSKKVWPIPAVSHNWFFKQNCWFNQFGSFYYLVFWSHSIRSNYMVWLAKNRKKPHKIEFYNWMKIYLIHKHQVKSISIIRFHI